MRTLIHIAAAVIANDEGQTLLVRKQGTSAFMQAGGKIASGETSLAALEREIREELSCEIAGIPKSLGTFRAIAVNEDHADVIAELFLVTLDAEPQVSGEIEEMIWVSPDEALSLNLARLTRDHVLPVFENLL